MQQEQKRVGPFQAVGIALNTVSTVAVVLDNTIKSSGEVIHKSLQGINYMLDDGLTALRMTSANALADMETDNIIESAYREVRRVQATTEAKRILAQLALDPEKLTTEKE